jgi:hypothetical protein
MGILRLTFAVDMEELYIPSLICTSRICRVYTIVMSQRLGMICHSKDIRQNPTLSYLALHGTLCISCQGILIVPPLTPHIRPDLVIILRILQNLHVHLHDTHPLLITQLAQRPFKWDRHLTQARIQALGSLPHRAPDVGKDYHAGILKTAGNQRALEEQLLRERVLRQPRAGAVRQGPEGGDDDDLGAAGHQLTERLRESQVPTDQHADLAERRIEGDVRLVCRTRQVRPFWMPEVLLLVPSQDGPVVRDKRGDVEELGAMLLD